MSKDSLIEYSSTAGSNTDVGGVDISEGCAASNMNDAHRESMSHLANYVKDLGGVLDLGGAADVITVTANQTLAAYVDGFEFVGKAASDNELTTTTLNVNGLGAKKLKKNVAGTETAPAAGDIQGGGFYRFRYDPDLDSSSGGFWFEDLNHTTSSFTASSTDTLTNKTIDGDDNTLQDIPVSALKEGTDGELITWGADAEPATVAVGTSGQVLTSNGAGAAPTFQDASGGVFSESYTSSAQAVTAATLYTLAHSLSGAPKLIQPVLKCVTADGNWAVNDEILVVAEGYAEATANSYGFVTYSDATNIYIRQGSGPFLLIHNKTTGTGFLGTRAKWNLIMKAWY